MNGLNTIRLLGTKRIKTFSIAMLIMIPCILFFFTLAIQFTMPNNLILLIVIYLTFAVLFAIGIYLLFNTSDKLTIANLYVGICFIALSAATFGTFVYVVANERAKDICILIGAYILSGVVTEFIILKKKFFNFKELGKIKDTFWLYLLGLGIGKGCYEFIKKAYGDNVSDFIGIGAFLVMAVFFGFMGIFYINKLYIVNKYEFQIHIVYEE